MTFQQLLYVVTVAEECSFSKAARRLFISQPSLSQYIKNLEGNLNVILFDRSTNPIKVTDSGKVFVNIAKKILDLKGELDDRMDSIANMESGTIYIGVSPFRTSIFMPYIISEFKKRYPGINISIVEGHINKFESDIVNSDIDFFVTTLPVSERLMDYEFLMNERIMLAVPPQFEINKRIDNLKGIEEVETCGKKYKKIRLEIFKDEPFIFLKPDQKIHKLADRLCNKAGFEPNIVMENTNMDSSIAMTIGGLGISFVPDTVVKYGNMANNPVYYYIDDEEAVRKAVIAYRKNREFSKSALEFIRVMKDSLT